MTNGHCCHTIHQIHFLIKVHLVIWFWLDFFILCFILFLCQVSWQFDFVSQNLSNFLNFLIRIREIKYISIRIKALRCPNTQIIQAVRPCLKEWIGRSWGRGGESYRMTQIFTGRGYFGEYLYCIGKEHTARCHYCAANRAPRNTRWRSDLRGQKSAGPWSQY